MKRVWKPLDVGGLRLYVVWMRFHHHPEWNKDYVVAAKSPTHACQLVTETYADAIWQEEPLLKGRALDILMPESWWEKGVPIVGEGG